MSDVHVEPGRHTPSSSSDSAVLSRILHLLEDARRKPGIELVTAIVLSLATLCSTWCGYQSQQWSSVSTAAGSKADTTERQAAENAILGLQIRTQDGLIVLEYWRAMRSGDAAVAENLRTHMPPRLTVAIEAAVAEGILHNPKVPGPLHRPEYVIEQETQAAQQRQDAIRLNGDARSAGHASDGYVLVTLMFASVLFFGGISTTIRTQRIRIALNAMAILVFGLSIITMLGLPILIS
jgi:hypothetical protein